MTSSATALVVLRDVIMMVQQRHELKTSDSVFPRQCVQHAYGRTIRDRPTIPLQTDVQTRDTSLDFGGYYFRCHGRMIYQPVVAHGASLVACRSSHVLMTVLRLCAGSGHGYKRRWVYSQSRCSPRRQAASGAQSSWMDFTLRLPIGRRKHQMIIILTNPTSDIWILRLTWQTCWRDFMKTGCTQFFAFLKLITPWTKWPPFHTRFFRCIFVNESFCILIKISLQFVSMGPTEWMDNNLALV